MIDILYLASNRLEFTRASMGALLANTDWALVRSITVYDDDSTDGTREYLEALAFPVPSIFRAGKWGSPVAIMNEFILTQKPAVFAKIDNDTMVPPGWLSACQTLLAQNPGVSLLGIEPHHPVATNPIRRYAESARYIGGIGLIRGEAFDHSLPRPDGRFGFTAWQDHNQDILKAWINPALPVVLLDRLPMEPWASLSATYEAKGWQRPWAKYDISQSALWSWFLGGSQ